MRRIILLGILILLLHHTALAQTGGQFCVRGFEDRNGNGLLDGGEPLLTSGLSADLLNAEQIIVASALLAESPTAAQGVICFQLLAPGQYSLVITAAEYQATTPNTLTAAITDGTLPTVMEFGARRRDAVAEEAQAPAQPALADRDTLARLVLSVLGALIVMAGMIVLGVAIYLFVVRPRRQPAMSGEVYAAAAPRSAADTSESIPRVVVDSAADTDEIPTVT
jgi:hypothetical protein